jgi:polyisoprenoid-binding protein YceI
MNFSSTHLVGASPARDCHFYSRATSTGSGRAGLAPTQLQVLQKLLGLFTLLFIVNTAQAVEFSDVQAAKSTMIFGYKQMNVPLSGKFAKFNIVANFDPAKPAAAQAKINIDLSSIDTGNSDADEEVLGKLWFDTKQFPYGQFVAGSIKSLGGNRYEAQGKLTLKGKTLAVSAPFTFKQEGANGVFDGAFKMNRLDYAIGTGIWADIATVANEVSITFHFVASSKK